MFRQLVIPRNVVTSMRESYCFRTNFESQSVQGFQTLPKRALDNFFRNFPLTQDKLSWKTSLLVRSKILALFGNTLTANHMYSRHRWVKFSQQGQTLLSQKRKTFSENVIAFLKFTQNFGHSEKEDQLHSLNISKVIDLEKYSYFNARKFLF